MSTTTFDIESFNEAAQTFWDEAYKRGLTEGAEKGSADTARWQMRGNIDLAERMLRTACGTPIGEGDELTRFLSTYARLLLTRTPMMHPIVGWAIDALKREDWIINDNQDPDRVAIQAVADNLGAAVIELGGY